VNRDNIPSNEDATIQLPTFPYKVWDTQTNDAPSCIAQCQLYGFNAAGLEYASQCCMCLTQVPFSSLITSSLRRCSKYSCCFCTNNLNKSKRRSRIHSKCKASHVCRLPVQRCLYRKCKLLLWRWQQTHLLHFHHEPCAMVLPHRSSSRELLPSHWRGSRTPHHITSCYRKGNLRRKVRDRRAKRNRRLRTRPYANQQLQ
jgi:hypothetical protein